MAFTFSLDRTKGDGDGSLLVAKWAGGAAGDAGGAWAFPEWADASVQVSGTISGSTVTIDGSNDGTNWATLFSAQAAALSFTSLTPTPLKQIVERPLYIRPNITGGTGSAIEVTIVARRANPLRT